MNKRPIPSNTRTWNSERWQNYH